MLVALVDELHDTSTVSDQTWTALTEHYDEAQLVELVALAGQYHAVSFMANALGVEREDAAQRFPAAKAA
jgi:alkylhydroperoxidase family enzyme